MKWWPLLRDANWWTEYLCALDYDAHRQSRDKLRKLLTDMERRAEGPLPPKQRRRLDRRAALVRRRLEYAEYMENPDWADLEERFIAAVATGAQNPEVFERWRRSGISIRVLNEARKRGARS